jgi:hypothetical protein
MSALGMGQAASTLAIAQVGFDLELFDREVVNAAVLAVVATAFISSYGTRYSAGRVERPPLLELPLGERCSSIPGRREVSWKASAARPAQYRLQTVASRGHGAVGMTT